MKIINRGHGIHIREVTGISKLQAGLPQDWLGFTNLELTLPHGNREIDVILITVDRLVLVDLKDWKGKIESSGGSWRNGGNPIDGMSPVEKVLTNARELRIMLERYLREQARRKKQSSVVEVPKIDGCVVLTATTDRSGIASTEVGRVFSIDPFVEMLKSVPLRIQGLGGASPAFHNGVLLTSEWREHWERFFNVRTGSFRASSRRYGGYQATSDNFTFQHSKEIYREYDVVDHAAAGATGLLRRWDLTKADARFQTAEARAEIAGREREVISWLNDRSPECESSVLQPRIEDSERGVDYWEVFDRRRRLQRLKDLSTQELLSIQRDLRIELVRQILSKAKCLHDLGVSHLDIGPHSVWIETPSTVRLSHLMAARFPEIRSLGVNRYQFLSVADLPERVLDSIGSDAQKDVFLIACVAHLLLFGAPPQSLPVDNIPEWLPTADKENQFPLLHNWFGRALAWSPSDRYADAGEMLSAFSEALEDKLSTKAVIEALERFKTTSSQMKLFREYPSIRDIRDDARLAMWVSDVEGQQVLIKMWKRESWGDQALEAPRLLAFLEHAQLLILDQPPGCVPLRKAIWTGDALVLVQDFCDSPTLADSNVNAPSLWALWRINLRFLLELARYVVALHDRQVSHGDLKPENILVVGIDSLSPLLIDLVDFSPREDGEIRTTLYCPKSGGRFERDRYAVTKIVEEQLRLCNNGESHFDSIVRAIEIIRRGPPENASLLPLIEALTAALEAPSKPKTRELEISFPGASPEDFPSDEGKLGIRFSKYGRQLRVRGAAAQLVFELSEEGVPKSVRRLGLDHGQSDREARIEVASMQARLRIQDGTVNDFECIEALLKEPEFEHHLRYARDDKTQQGFPKSGDGDEVIAPDGASTVADEDELEDQLGEKIAAQGELQVVVDVPKLWRRLIDVESELFIEGVAIGPSVYRNLDRRHIVPFELQSGSLDFPRDDTVTITRQDRSERWTQVGTLDLGATRSNVLVFDTWRFSGTTDSKVIEDGQALRLASHYEETSRSRRRDAILRVLNRGSRTPNLVDVFQPESGLCPEARDLIVDREEIRRLYGFNKAQEDAFVDLVRLRPVGFLQGPPGTGKTRFISALVHYSLTKNLVRNILLASQSHEAVNGAAEAVINLFKTSNEIPSILRIGHEDNVSSLVLPHHVARVEARIKDRFSAEIEVRLGVAGSALGLPEKLIRDLTILETVIRPIVDKLQYLEKIKDRDDVGQRVLGLKNTLQELTQRYGFEQPPVEQIGDNYVDGCGEALAFTQGVTNMAKVKAFTEVALLSRDFIGSVSTRRRTFETFLAGTRQIVVGTCVGLGRSTLGLTATPFDLVIVDEAARCTASELAVPLQAGRWTVLVGDHLQLEPQHKAEVVKNVAKDLAIPEREITRSDFERAFTSEYGQQAGFTLTEQHRMLPPIGRVVSAAFYSGRLTHGRTSPVVEVTTFPDTLEAPLTWLSTDEFLEAAWQRNARGARVGALDNPVEANLIVSMIKTWDAHEGLRQWLDGQTRFPHAIGIICTYRAQAALISKLLRRSGISDTMQQAIKVDTVDSYQGKENPIVVLSLVRNNEDGAYEGAVKTIREGFMSRPNRLNVAVSRAMDRLVIVGALARWRSSSPVSQVVDAFSQEIENSTAKIINGVTFRGLLDLEPSVREKKKKKGRAAEKRGKQ